MGLSGSFSLLPSTNVNRGTKNTDFLQFNIDSSSQAQSGLGVHLGIAGYFRTLIDPTSRINLNWNLSGAKYKDDEYSSLSGKVSLSYEKTTKSGRWFLSPYHRKIKRWNDGDYKVWGLGFGLTHNLDNKNRLVFSMSHEMRNFQTLNHQDGTFTSASLSRSYQLSPSISINGGF